MKKETRVYIIGFMGSGKTTAARRLASQLGWSYIDLDSKIEEKEKRSIPEIFSKSGEDYFRKVESEILREMGTLERTIISTGGGTPCHGSNMDFMLETGLTIYLKLPADQLQSRLSVSKTVRPLIRDLDSEKLTEFIHQKLAEREKFYTRAEITVDGTLNITGLSEQIGTRIS